MLARILAACLASLVGITVLNTAALAYRMVGTEAEFIERAGFTDDAQVVWHGFAVHPKSVRSEFMASEEKLVYFMVFRNLKYLRKVNFKAEWIDPSGNLHHQSQFTQIQGRYDMAQTEFMIRGTHAASLPGKWRLRVFEDNGEIITDRAFIIKK